MSTFSKLKQLSHSVLVDFHECNRRAEEARTRETKATIVIQAAWRSFLVRKRIRHITRTAITIQRYWRGYLGRLRYQIARAAADKKLRKAYFDVRAREIQRVFRGWWSRKYIFNFATRRAFLNTVAERNSQVRQQMSEELLSSTKLLQEQAAEGARQQFEQRISRLHHLVSTAAIPGVFNSPYANLMGTVPIVGGQPIEGHFKDSMRKQVSSLPPVRAPASHRRATSSPAASRLTLRQSTTYDLLAHELRMEKMVQHGQVLATHPVDFMNVVRPKPPFTEVQSVRNCEAYHDPWDPTIGNRTDTFDVAARTISIKPFAKYLHGAETFQDTVEQAY